jgi:hypothetical protein
LGDPHHGQDFRHLLAMLGDLCNSIKEAFGHSALPVLPAQAISLVPVTDVMLSERGSLLIKGNPYDSISRKTSFIRISAPARLLFLLWLPDVDKIPGKIRGAAWPLHGRSNAIALHRRTLGAAFRGRRQLDKKHCCGMLVLQQSAP